jgi:hypothetical protein
MGFEINNCCTPERGAHAHILHRGRPEIMKYAFSHTHLCMHENFLHVRMLACEIIQDLHTKREIVKTTHYLFVQRFFCSTLFAKDAHNMHHIQIIPLGPNIRTMYTHAHGQHTHTHTHTQDTHTYTCTSCMMHEDRARTHSKTVFKPRHDCTHAFNP